MTNTRRDVVSFAMESMLGTLLGTVNEHFLWFSVFRNDASPTPIRRARVRLDCPRTNSRVPVLVCGGEAAEQSAALRDAVLLHLAVYDSSVIVMEEYDKMGCAARGVLQRNCWRK